MLQRVASLLEHGWVVSNLDAARLYPGDRIQLARRAFSETGLVRGDDPRMVAVALGFRIVRAPWLVGCGGEVTDGLRIVYRPGRSEEGDRACAAHGLAHALLFRERWDHSEADALLLTADFLPPLR